jgi:hypothetical protein
MATVAVPAIRETLIAPAFVQLPPNSTLATLALLIMYLGAVGKTGRAMITVGGTVSLFVVRVTRGAALPALSA